MRKVKTAFLSSDVWTLRSFRFFGKKDAGRARHGDLPCAADDGPAFFGAGAFSANVRLPVFCGGSVLCFGRALPQKRSCLSETSRLFTYQ